MKIEKFNDSSKKIKLAFVIGFILCAIIMIVINLLTSKAKYQNTQSINIATGKVSYTLADLNMVAMYKINDDETEEKLDEVPGAGYILNEESKCTIKGANGKEEKDSKITIEYINNEIKIDHMTKKGTKCYIYFEKLPTAEDTLAKLNLQSKGKRDSFTGPSDANDKGIWEADDNDGKSYYFRGLVENNYVKFAGFYWRIIRINGDGSIRMIYAGSKGTTNGSCSDCAIGSGAYNTDYGDNMYVGFRYKSNEVHGTEIESDILKNETYGLNKWYETNILGKDAESHIEKSAGFCNDRTNSTSSSTAWGSQKNDGGTGSTTTYYGAYLRILTNGSWRKTQTPTLKCTNNDDLFTASNDKNKGNGTLVYPIGLITADEVVFAGGFGGKTSRNYYLYTGQYYWTMSPCYVASGFGYVFIVYNYGDLAGYGVQSKYGVRPVINLKADTSFSSGDGSFEHPFEAS